VVTVVDGDLSMSQNSPAGRSQHEMSARCCELPRMPCLATTAVRPLSDLTSDHGHPVIGDSIFVARYEMPDVPTISTHLTLMMNICS
jgi:hypothetical protein